MSFALLATMFAGITGAGLMLIGVLLWTSPERALKCLGHEKEQLPRVMADRYVAIATIGIFAAFYQDLNLVFVFFAVCAVMAFADVHIYYRAGHATKKHLRVGLLSLVAGAITLVARLNEGGA